MQRLAVIGLDTEKEKLINRLMDLGVVEITDQTAKLSEEDWAAAAVTDEDQETVSAIDGRINRAEQALEVIEKYGNLKSPLFKTRRRVKKARFDEIVQSEEKAAADVELILGLAEKINAAAEKFNKLETDAVSLSPWTGYDLPLELETTRRTGIYMGVMPVDTDTQALAKQLEEEAETVVFKVVHTDKDMHYAAAVVTDDRQDQVLAILKQNGFSQVFFKGFSGTVEENLERIRVEKETLSDYIASVEAEVAENAGLKTGIEEYADMLAIRLDKEKIRGRLLKTKKTFFIEGWVPTRYEKEIKEILDDSGCYYQLREPLEDEEVPVALDNPSFFAPSEAITEMYSLPAYRGFDPTSIFALFYILFFGIMFSDAGYGLILTIGCFVIMKKFDLEGMTRKMINLFFYCGISTAVFGALFGGWFGDVVTVFGNTFLNKEIVLGPLWFNPLEDPMKMLIFSLVFGVVHLFVGMGIAAYMQIREGKWWDAICDEGFWYVTILGIAAWLGGPMIGPAALGTAGMYMTIAGALGLLLTGGRDRKGIGKVIGGLSNLYNITSWMSDILSYARLLALGLATGVIAQVVNTMAALFGGGIAGAVFFVIVFIVGHVINFAINVLGAFIHSARLQYVEFFGKFYMDGGEPFDPFRRKTKYIRIEDEE